VRTGTEMRVGEKFDAVGHEQRGAVWGPLRSKRIGRARVSALIMSG